MILGMHATKLVVGDVEAAERFYVDIGLKPFARNSGGEGDFEQQQCWMSVTGDSQTHVLILSRFPNLPAPARPAYPGEVWLAFNVADVDAICGVVEGGGGKVLRTGEDIAEHGVRAAVVADLEGHVIEIVGPMLDAAGSLADPLAKGATPA